MDQRHGLEVAVIGQAGCFPGAKNIDEFWQLLEQGREGLTVFSDEELLAAGVSMEEINAKGFVRKQGIIKDKALFDAPLFDYSAKEAQAMDPQFRIFHQVVWQAMESAGYDSERYAGLIGLYAGAGNNIDWMTQFMAKDNALADLFTLDTLTSGDYLTTRVAHKFNFRGPAVTVQTACSTSLVAVHHACQSLNTGECDMALAGGINIPSLKHRGYLFQEGMILSPDGSCRPFDQQANGTNASDGCGVVVLKRLQEAEEDGDNILAVIKGSAIGNDGRDKVGYTAPGISGQLRVLESAYQVAEVDPASISYIEAHGTGTSLGDPIEIEALTLAFNSHKTAYCKIGSVKSNIGHTVIAAGIAGMIKTILAMQHKQLPASINFSQANPHIDFEQSPFVVNKQLCSWQGDNGLLRAGVSSFGIGGTNAHIVLENYPAAPQTVSSGIISSGDRGTHLLSLSANSASALQNLGDNLHQHINDNPHLELADLCYTLQMGRKALPYRRTFTATTTDELMRKLGATQGPDISVVNSSGTEQKLCFMFPGQGVQYAQMGKQLYQQQGVFRAQLDRCFAILAQHSEFDFKSVLFASAEESEHRALYSTAYTQALLFTFEYALAKLLISWGCKPEIMLGHSVGEYVCACLAEVFSLSDALLLMVKRGSLIQSLPPGCMLSVACSETTISRLLDKTLCLSAVNAPERVVIGGDEEAISQLELRLDKLQITHTRLHTSHAFHCHHLDPVLEEFSQVLETITLSAPRIAFISNLTGDIALAEDVMSVSYWVKHLRQTVRFADAIATLSTVEPGYIYLEVGPGSVLTRLLKQSFAEHKPICIQLNQGSHRSDFEYQDLCAGLGQMFVTGIAVDWSAYYSQQKHKRLALPTYPFAGLSYQAKEINPIKAAEKETDSRHHMEHWLYLPQWIPATQKSKEALAETAYFWLIFTDDYGIGEGIGQQLASSAKAFVLINQAQAYQHVTKQTISINPSSKQHYRRLIQQISETTDLPLNVIYLWTVWPAQKSLTDEVLQRGKTFAFNSLLFLAQALGQAALRPQCQINIVTSNLYRLTQRDALCVEKSLVSGINNALGLELQKVSSRNIDLYLQADGQWQLDVSVDQLLRQCSDSTLATIVAIRSKIVWQQQYQPLPLPESNDQCLRGGGTYLITGGLGQIGLLLAEYLATHYDARVILTTRRVFPKKSQWQSIIDTKQSHPQLSLIRRLSALEQNGASIEVIQADVAKREQMQDLFNWINKNNDSLNGIFHLAAEMEPVGLMELNKALAEHYFASKVQGTLNLAHCIELLEPDFCMLFSSLSTVLGGAGFTAYAAANSFLDAIVECLDKDRNGTRWLSVNWDGWANEKLGKMNDLNRKLIQPEEGIKLILPLLMLNRLAPRILVSTSALNSRIKRFASQQQALGAQETEDSISHTRPETGNDYVAPESETEKHLARLWRDYLGLDKVGIHDSFFDLGGDSLLGIRLINQIRQDFKIDVPIQTFLAHHTISDFATVLDTVIRSHRVEQESEEDPDNNKVTLTL